MGRFLEGIKNIATGLGVFVVGLLAIVGSVKVTQWFGILLSRIFNIIIEPRVLPVTGAIQGTFLREFWLGFAGWIGIIIIVCILQLARAIGEEINGKN